MSDTPVRPGPPIPQPLARTPAAEEASPSSPTGPTAPVRVGPPVPASLATTPSATATTTRPAQPRTTGPRIGPTLPAQPRPAGPRIGPTLPATAPAITARPAPRAHTAPGIDLVRIGATILVIALVVAAIWADRDRIEPVPGYGVVPQPGASEVVTLTAPLKVGDTAPNFRLRTTDGEALELADLRGQPVVIQFWTTWCIECTSELPTLQNLAGKYDGRAHVLGIDVGEQADRAEDAAREYGVTYPVALDADEEVSRHYGAYTLPTVIVIDANGVITSLASGSIPMDSLAPQLDALVSS